MKSIQTQQIVDRLTDREIVLVEVERYHPLADMQKRLPGIVRKGNGYFYVQVDGEHHPGASVSAGSIVQCLSVLQTEFQVRDALGGNVSGNYKADLAILEKNGKTCDRLTYEEAYQMQEQP